MIQKKDIERKELYLGLQTRTSPNIWYEEKDILVEMLTGHYYSGGKLLTILYCFDLNKEEKHSISIRPICDSGLVLSTDYLEDTPNTLRISSH